MTTDEIRKIRYSQIIKDPFPEHTAYNEMKKSAGAIERVLGYPNLPEAPEPISIWAAYRMGYEKAYEEMMAAANLVGESVIECKNNHFLEDPTMPCPNCKVGKD